MRADPPSIAQITHSSNGLLSWIAVSRSLDTIFIGSPMLGIAGAIFAHHRGFIGTTTYAFGSVDVRVIVMLAFGGIGSLLGPVLGPVVLTILDELLVSYAQLREVLYGIVIVGLFLGFRRGVIPTLESRWPGKPRG